MDVDSLQDIQQELQEELQEELRLPFDTWTWLYSLLKNILLKIGANFVRPTDT